MITKGYFLDIPPTMASREVRAAKSKIKKMQGSVLKLLTIGLTKRCLNTCIQHDIGIIEQFLVIYVRHDDGATLND